MSNIFGITLNGMDAQPVEVEVEMTGGLFSIAIVGMPDTAVRESRERVRSALRTLGVNLKGHVAVNLAPADIPKEGALLDLPIALAMLESSGMIMSDKHIICMGELGLDGQLRRVRGAVPAAFLARKLDLPIFVPKGNAEEVALVRGVKAFYANTLAELVSVLQGDTEPTPVPRSVVSDIPGHVEPDFADIKGQANARRAAEIAAAGHHNMLMIGSPGSGKTLIAKAMRGILPPLSDDELVETLMIRSTIGLQNVPTRMRPFRDVHFTASAVSICGGGVNLRPGEISLAHRGVLFLDEFTEFRRDLIESLRAPLEDGQITVSRATGSVVYPSRVLLVLAANPCRCGFLGDTVIKCTCTDTAIENYRRKLSGPILDRIDLQINVPRLTPEELLSFKGTAESSSTIRERVIRARKIQQERWGEYGYTCNAELPEKIVRNLDISNEAMTFLVGMGNRLQLSGRGLSRILKVARTIADLADEREILKPHITEALGYRQGTNRK